MIVHKTFIEHTMEWTTLTPIDRREKVRQEMEHFLNVELQKGTEVLSISETATAIGGLFAVTVWYKEPDKQPSTKRLRHLRPEEESAEMLERLIHPEQPANAVDMLLSERLVHTSMK